MEEYRGLVLVCQTGQWFAYENNERANVIVHYAASLEECKREVDEYYSGEAKKYFGFLLVGFILAGIVYLGLAH